MTANEPHCAESKDAVPYSQMGLSLRGIASPVVLLAFAAFAQSPSRVTRFSGEVKRGEAFTHDIGQGLEFALRPASEDPSGWTITVSAKGPRPAGCDDLVWVATPPFRSFNQRYLDLSYGTSPRQAVAMTPREFSFVLNCADYAVEEKRVTLVLWPYAATEAEVQDALAKLGTSPLGKGTFFIRDSRIIDPEGKNPGSIDWLRFDVELEFPR